jgi:hypothetical protein
LPPPAVRPIVAPTGTTAAALLDELRAAAQAGQALALGDRPDEERTLDGPSLRALLLELDGVDPVGVSIAGAHVVGRLDLSGATLPFPLWFHATSFDEPLAAMYARIPILSLDGCTLPGLHARRLTAPGLVAVTSCTVAGDIGLEAATLGALDCRSTTVECEPDESALSLRGARIDGDAILTSIRVRGGVSGEGARVAGSLSFDGANVAAAAGDALKLDQVSVGGDIHLTRLTAAGRVSLDRAQVGRAVFFASATIENAGGEALSLRHAEVADLVHLGDGFRAAGKLLLSGARIGGELDCCRATIDAGAGAAVTMIRTDVHGAMLLTDAVVTGHVNVMNARVGGILGLARASIDGDVEVLHAELGSSVLLDGFAATGAALFLGARIGGDLNVVGARIGSLSVVQTEVAGQLILRESSSSGVTFVSSEAGMLTDEPGSWSAVAPYRLDGLAYARLATPGDVAQRVRWLRSTAAYEPTAWLQLASVLRASGREGDATRVLIAMQNDRLRRGGLSPAARLGRQILRITIGHGYRPWLAGLWAAVVVAAFAIVVWQAPERFVAAKDGVHGLPQPLVYAADTFLPIVDFGQAGDWDATGWTRWAAWAVIAVGWALTTIFVGGFTKLVRSS